MKSMIFSAFVVSLLAIGTQGVQYCNGSAIFDRVEVLEEVAASKTLWVDTANAGDPCANGSPEHPFWRIQDGINAAVNGDEVVVADGTYTGAGNTVLNFGGRLITLRSESGRDNCIIDCQGSVQGFTFENGETDQAVLDGFTIQKGYSLFGGMYVNSSPTIIGCRFIECISVLGGGGMYMYNSHSRIEDCEFIANAGYGDGGGLYVVLGGPSIINCRFAENFASVKGGGIFAEATNLTVTGCKFLGNKPDGLQGGGGLFCTNSNITLTDCIFSGNYSPFSGGAIFCRNSTLTAIGCSFVGNYAAGDDFDGRKGGGGLFVEELGGTQQVLIQNCIFSGNLAKTTGGGICCLAGSNMSVANCLFTGNRCQFLAGAGGITSWDQADVAASNCTFADNRGDYGSVWGWPAVASLSNCILWNPGIWTGETYAASVRYSNIRGGYEGQGNINADPCFSVDVSGAWTADAVYDSAAYTVTCTDENASWQSDELAGLFIYPGGYLWPVFPIITNTSTTVTIYADAQTIWDGASAIKAGSSYNIRDYHLAPDSPCIDAGDPNYVPGPNETDLDGLLRLVDGDCNDTDRVDMGSYEFSYAYMGDLDYNCHVDFEDYAILSSAWLTTSDNTEWNAICDISVPADRYIDWRDLAVLCDNWLTAVGP